jgi:hypothetical protein
MKQRGVSRDQVEMCLNYPDEKYPDAKGKMVYAKNFAGILVRIVVKPKSAVECLIITVKN